MDSIQSDAHKFAETMLENQMAREIGRRSDPITNLGALSYTHKYFVEELSDRFGSNEKEKIAYWCQNVVETVVKYWLDHFFIKRCTFVGGCFLNVQLNGSLCEVLDEACFMPLSGDEGAGFGIYKYFNPDFVLPDSLSWGHRDLSELDLTGERNIRYSTHPAEDLIDLFKNNKIVNVVRGSMEYGPRAYCNTSTLALPTEKNRAYINHLNQRYNRMPMCPVVTEKQYDNIFQAPCALQRSTPHMIVALPFKSGYIGKYPGVEYTRADGLVTGRPQVVSDTHWLKPVLDKHGPLINTSFNNHGKPIVWSMAQVLDAHMFMLNHDEQCRVVTLIDISETNQSATG